MELYTASGESPRLEKVIAEAMREFNMEEAVVEDKNKKGGKAPPAKKDDKKGAKKEEEKKEPTANELECKKLVNIQKSIFRYRLQMIRSFGLGRLQ